MAMNIIPLTPPLPLPNVLPPGLEIIVDMFPNVEPTFFTQKLRDGWAVDRIIDYALMNAKDLPQKRLCIPASPETPYENRKPQATIPNSFVERFSLAPSMHISTAYTKAALQVLEHDFSMVYVNTIRNVFHFENSRYAPAYRTLLKAVETCFEGQNCIIKCKGDFTPCQILKINRNLRKASPKRSTMPVELLDEINWTVEHFKDQLIELHQKFDTKSFKRISDETAPAVIVFAGEVNSTNFASLECNVCFEEFDLNQTIMCCKGHSFCIQCAKSHVEQALYGQAKVDIPCMESSCDSIFSPGALRAILDRKTWKKLAERRLEEDLASAQLSNLVRCKFCSYGVIMEAPVETNKVFTCGNKKCGRSFCRICDIDWEKHIGIPCHDVETDKDLKFRREAEEKLTEAIVRKCSRCVAPIVKLDDGRCNKITCRCGTTMCYLCRTPNIDYDHFCRHPTSPGKACSVCTKCSLWVNPQFIDTENFLKAQEGIKLAQQELLGKLRPIGVQEDIVAQ